MRNDFESNYLEHSAKGTSWTKKGAKYISRIKKNGKWVYQYKITGKGYKKAAEQNKSDSEVASWFAKDKNGNYTDKNAVGGRGHVEAKRAESYGRKAAQEEYNYKTKSLAGITENIVTKGQNKINNILSKLKTTTTETVKDTFTGKTRTPDRSGETINIKELSEKNKKKK